MNRLLWILQVADFTHRSSATRYSMSRWFPTTFPGVAIRSVSRWPGCRARHLIETAYGVTIRGITGSSSRLLTDRYQRSDAPHHPLVPDPGVVAELKRVVNESRPTWFTPGAGPLTRASRWPGTSDRRYASLGGFARR